MTSRTIRTLTAAALILALSLPALAQAQWYAVYRVSTGELVSTGTAIGEDLAAKGLASTAIAGFPDPDKQAWNKTNRAFEVKPASVAAPNPAPFDKASADWTTKDIADALKWLREQLLK